MNPTEFGAFLCGERKKKGLTQRELADRVGVTDKAVSKWERGVCLPEVGKFGELAAALDLTELEILKGRRLPDAAEPEPPAPPEPPSAPLLTPGTLRRLIIGCLALTVPFFLWDMLEQSGHLLILGAGDLMKPVLAAAWGARCALQCPRTTVTPKAAALYSLGIAGLAAMVRDPLNIWFFEINLLNRIFRTNVEAVLRSIYQADLIWTPRALGAKFVVVELLNEWTIAGFLLCFAAFLLVRLIRAVRGKRLVFSNI